MIIKEKELKEYVKNFDRKNIKLIVTGIVEAESQLSSVSISYDYKRGFLKIKNKENKISINMVSVEKMHITEDYKRLEIRLEDLFDTEIHIIEQE